MAGNLSVIEKEAATNLVPNPSFGKSPSTGWTAYATGTGDGTRLLNGTIQRYSAYSLQLSKTVGAPADHFGQYAACGTSTSGQTYIATAWVYLQAGATAVLQIQKVAGVGVLQTASATTSTTGSWVQLTTAAITANATADAIRVFVWITGTITVTANVDAVAVYADDHVGTHVDGDQPGCYWLGASHNSRSARSGLSLAGGVAREMEATYSFYIDGYFGTGVNPQNVQVTPFALLDGGVLSSAHAMPREFTITGTITGTDLADLHVNRQALHEVLDPDVPGSQSIRLRYDGAAVEKQIACKYVTGLDGEMRAEVSRMNAKETVAIQFICEDPYWYEIGDSAAELDTNDALTVRHAMARLTSTGQWTDFGIAAPTAYTGVNMGVFRASDGTIYYFGDFTDFAGVAGADMVVQYNPVTNTWALVGAASDFSNDVLAMAEGPDGTIYLGGLFLDAGGADGDYIAKYTPSTDTVAPLLAGGSGAVWRIVVDPTGILYFAGAFTDWDADATQDYISSYSGGAYVSLGAADAIVYGLAMDLSRNLIATGNFTIIGGVTAARIASWNGTAWSAMSTGLNAEGRWVGTRSDGAVFVVGDFTTAGGAACLRAARWDGATFKPLGSGTNNDIREAAIAPDGTLWTAGTFTSAGGITVNRAARFLGESWSPLDNVISGAPSIFGIAFGPTLPVSGEYDVWIAQTIDGAAQIAGDVTITNNGNARVYPEISITRAGGTSARIVSLRNVTAGQELNFDYSLLSGETLTISLAPLEKRIMSSFFGPVPDALITNSEFAIFALLPGANIITAFVDTVGATVTGTVVWKDAYRSMD